ncbi:TRAP transporter substrate-binding protein [Litchfieldella qijiaojingensis]|nr:TRAP transporter substrate-binding protein [Halomonas qijiaojingensis]
MTRKCQFLKRWGVKALCTAVATLGISASAFADGDQSYRWSLVTSWPKNFPGLGIAPENFASMVDDMSGGRLKIRVFGAGEVVPGFEVFDAVSNGTAQMGHSGSYYWKGKIPAAQFFAAIPFGMTAAETDGWLRYGGGMELWEELYQPHGVIPLAAGSTGTQMGGWFNKEINSVEDLQGLKMRIPGLGGEVLKRAGGVPVSLPGGEIFTALQTGAIDAVEWVGPYNDRAFGLNTAAKYYYYPGWHEPGSMFEFIVNEEAFQELPQDLQAIVRQAARTASYDMLVEYNARNIEALKQLQDSGVELRRFPEDLLQQLQVYSDEVVQELAEEDPMAARIYESYRAYQQGAAAYNQVAEQAYIETREQ